MSRKPHIKKLILQGDAHANIQATSLYDRIKIMHTFANKIFLAMNMNYLTLVRLKLTNSSISSSYHSKTKPNPMAMPQLPKNLI